MQSSATSSHLAISQVDALRRVIHYIDRLHAPADVSIRAFDIVFGLGSGASGEPGYSRFVSSDPTSGWTLWVEGWTRPGKALSYTIEHEAFNSDVSTLSLSEVCEMDFAELAAALEAIGFEAGPSVPNPSSMPAWETYEHSFSRGTLFVEVTSIAPRADAERTEQSSCVRTLNAGFLTAPMAE